MIYALDPLANSLPSADAIRILFVLGATAFNCVLGFHIVRAIRALDGAA